MLYFVKLYENDGLCELQGDSGPLHFLSLQYWVLMNFHQSFIKCSAHSPSRHQKTTTNLLKINFKGTFRLSNEQPLDVYKPVVKFSGACKK